MNIVVEHFNQSHKPEVCDFDSVTEILCRKCSKCFLGPFESQDDLLTHIGTAHGEMVDVWVNKLTLTKTLEPLKRVIIQNIFDFPGFQVDKKIGKVVKNSEMNVASLI